MLTLDQLAYLLHGAGHGNAQHAVSSLSSLARASANDVVYFDNPLLKPILQVTKAGIVLLQESHLAWCPVNALVVADPLMAMKEVARLLKLEYSHVGSAVIDVTARIHPSAHLVHEHQRWRRNAARFKRLDDYITKLNVLERKINEL